jgi:DNA modification methylase
MIIQGDCIQGMKTLPDRCVQTCITSPPYFGLRDYGTAIYEGGNLDCEHSISGWSDNLKPDCDRPERDGTKRQFCLKCGAKRIDDQIGLEETPEKYVEKMVAVFREVKRILRDDGTVWLNLGDSYCGSGGAGNQFGQLDSGLNKYKQAGTPKEIGLKPKDLIGIPWRVAFGLQADGWYLRQDIIWHKPNPMPESVTDRCTKSHEYIFLLSKSKNYYFDHEAIKEQATTVPTVRNKAAEGYQADYAKGDRFSEGERIYGADGKRNKRSVWTVNLKPYGGAHFATYPPELITPCVLAGCPEGGMVFDPFTGSGTTGAVALKWGRKFIGCELNPEYVKLAETRIANEFNLFT